MAPPAGFWNSSSHSSSCNSTQKEKHIHQPGTPRFTFCMSTGRSSYRHCTPFFLNSCLLQSENPRLLAFLTGVSVQLSLCTSSVKAPLVGRIVKILTGPASQVMHINQDSWRLKTPRWKPASHLIYLLLLLIQITYSWIIIFVQIGYVI